MIVTVIVIMPWQVHWEWVDDESQRTPLSFVIVMGLNGCLPTFCFILSVLLRSCLSGVTTGGAAMAGERLDRESGSNRPFLQCPRFGA